MAKQKASLPFPIQQHWGCLVPLPRVVSMGLSRELISISCPRETVGLWYPPPELNLHLCQAAQPQWSVRKWCWMTKPVPKGYHLCDSIYATELKWQNYTNGEQSSPRSGAGEEAEGVQGTCGHKGETRGIHVVTEMLCVLTLLISISWLWCCPIILAKSYHWRKLSKGYLVSLLFLTTAHESIIISK